MNGIDHAKRCVNHYRRLGLCPLPSRMEKYKGPLLDTYTDHYGDVPVPESVYENWQTTNIQIITGTQSPTPTKILVVDCDGDEAFQVWKTICDHHAYAPTAAWMSRTGGGGVHFYYRIPEETEECPGGIIWGIWDTWGDKGAGRWQKHKEIRILADRALVVAPPSIHVETGNPYRFEDQASPRRFKLPEVAPPWLLKMPRLTSPRWGPDKPERPLPPKRQVRTSSNYYTREEVLDAIGDRKLDVAIEWGLVPATKGPNPRGWVNCFVPGREDPGYSKPSGSFHYWDGTLQDRKDLTTISFFDLGVLFGHYETWQDCRDCLGDRFIGKRPKQEYKYEF